jgi:hypothetical protein
MNIRPSYSVRDQRRCVKNGNSVKTVWGVMYGQSGQGQIWVHPNSVGVDGSGEAERSIAPSGGTGSSGRWSLGPPWRMIGRSLPYVRQSRQDKVRRLAL